MKLIARTRIAGYLAFCATHYTLHWITLNINNQCRFSWFDKTIFLLQCINPFQSMLFISLEERTSWIASQVSEGTHSFVAKFPTSIKLSNLSFFAVNTGAFCTQLTAVLSTTTKTATFIIFCLDWIKLCRFSALSVSEEMIASLVS